VAAGLAAASSSVEPALDRPETTVAPSGGSPDEGQPVETPATACLGEITSSVTPAVDQLPSAEPPIGPALATREAPPQDSLLPSEVGGPSDDLAKPTAPPAEVPAPEEENVEASPGDPVPPPAGGSPIGSETAAGLLQIDAMPEAPEDDGSRPIAGSAGEPSEATTEGEGNVAPVPEEYSARSERDGDPPSDTDAIDFVAQRLQALLELDNAEPRAGSQSAARERLSRKFSTPADGSAALLKSPPQVSEEGDPLPPESNPPIPRTPDAGETQPAVCASCRQPLPGPAGALTCTACARPMCGSCYSQARRDDGLVECAACS
jgi:hypothetical protein